MSRATCPTIVLGAAAVRPSAARVVRQKRTPYLPGPVQYADVPLVDVNLRGLRFR